MARSERRVRQCGWMDASVSPPRVVRTLAAERCGPRHPSASGHVLRSGGAPCGLGVLRLQLREHLLRVDLHLPGRVDADADLVATYLEHRDHDLVADDDRLAGAA